MIKLWCCYFLDGPHPYCLVFQGEFKEKSIKWAIDGLFLDAFIYNGQSHLRWGSSQKRAFPRKLFAAQIPFELKKKTPTNPTPKSGLPPEASLKTFLLGEKWGLDAQGSALSHPHSSDLGMKKHLQKADKPVLGGAYLLLLNTQNCQPEQR